MVIVKGEEIPTTQSRILPGDFITFVYNGRRREVIVVAPNWKDNLDGYEVEDMALAQMIFERITSLDIPPIEGQLWQEFGNVTGVPFKTFTPSKMIGTRLIKLEIEESE